MNSISSPVFKTYLFAYSPPILWALLIYILSAQGVLPSFETSIADYVFKKSAHMFVYAVLYYLLWRAVQQTVHPSSSVGIWLLPLVLTLGYALSDELHQHFVPGRYGTLRDIGYDLLGAGIVFLRQYRYI